MFRNSFLKLFFTLVLFTTTAASFGQSLAAVDTKIKTYPNSRFDSVEQLAGMIDGDFETDLEKVRAIYSWITNNVAYSFEARSTMSITYRSEKERLQKEKQHQQRMARITLRSKKAVCHGYSMLFKELCDQLDIPCEIVNGFGKSFISDIASGFISDHAWNKVTIDGEDYLIDSTWGAGYMRGNRFIREVTDIYFLTPPEYFIRNHYPEDPYDSLLDDFISKEEYVNQPLVYEDALINYHLIKPSSGVLKRKDTHTFEIKSKVPISELSYLYNGSWRDVEALSVDNNTYRFQITLPNKIDKELIIFINSEMAFGFKIKS